MSNEEVERQVIGDVVEDFGEVSAPDFATLYTGGFGGAIEAAYQTRPAVQFASPQPLVVDVQCPRCKTLFVGNDNNLEVDHESFTATCTCPRCQLFINVEFERA